MKNIYILSIGLTSGLFIESAAATDWSQNLYLNADIGSAFRPDTILHESFGSTAHTTYNTGIRADIALGYNINKSWALELSTGVLWNSVDAVNGVPLSTFNETFDIYLIPNLASVIYKIPGNSSWNPYVGVGVGAVVSVATIQAGNYHGGNPDLSDSDYAFAYQAEAGLDYCLTKNISIGVSYKFLGMLGQSWYMKSFYNHLSTDAIYTHTVLFDFNWRF